VTAFDYYRFAFRVLAAFSPNHAKFCGDRLKNARDIHNQIFVLLENVGQSSPKIFWGMLLQKTPNHAKFYGDR